jgi:hypothetical protein
MMSRLRDDQIALPSQLPLPDGALVVWVIYEHPSDCPGGYVLRAQYAGRDGLSASRVAWRGNHPDELRAILPPGVTCLGRNPDDEPQILEVWV